MRPYRRPFSSAQDPLDPYVRTDYASDEPLFIAQIYLNGTRLRCMLVADVAVGKAWRTTSQNKQNGLCRPPSGYNTVVGDVRRPEKWMGWWWGGRGSMSVSSTLLDDPWVVESGWSFEEKNDFCSVVQAYNV